MGFLSRDPALATAAQKAVGGLVVLALLIAGAVRW